MRVLGFIFLSLIISGGVLYFSHTIGGSFIDNFLGGDFITTYATLVGLNLAAVTFLLAQLISMEEKRGEEIFAQTKKEIRHNSLYLLFSLPLSILILSFRADLVVPATLRNNLDYYVSNLIVLILFALTIFAIYEILTAIFRINKNVFNKDKR